MEQLNEESIGVTLKKILISTLNHNQYIVEKKLFKQVMLEGVKRYTYIINNV